MYCFLRSRLILIFKLNVINLKEKEELFLLKSQVCSANKDLVKHDLALFTWGNVSAITKDRKFVVIKPSGVLYNKMQPSDIVVVDLNGKIVEGKLKPSSDTMTHLELYRNFNEINSVVHTHSRFATSFAQAKKPIKVFGTTHADHFNGNIPVTRDMLSEEIKSDYELNTGKVIVETFEKKKLSPLDIPACLVASHGVFTWGNSCNKAVNTAVILEEIAVMNIYSFLLNPKLKEISKSLKEKHFFRKHGKNAYYGQK